MKCFLSFLTLLLLVAGCSTRNEYDVLQYLGPAERDSVLTSIVTHIFVAPPYTEMKDRFKSEHRSYYARAQAKFSIEQYFIAADGTHYFYVLRPAPKLGEKRAVGGHFKLKDSYQLEGFREDFVTQIMPEKDIQTKCAFLFDELVKGNIEKYLPMESYIQWPNKISVYDTTTYEWKMIPQ